MYTLRVYFSFTLTSNTLAFFNRHKRYENGKLNDCLLTEPKEEHNTQNKKKKHINNSCETFRPILCIVFYEFCVL